MMCNTFDSSYLRDEMAPIHLWAFKNIIVKALRDSERGELINEALEKVSHYLYFIFEYNLHT